MAWRGTILMLVVAICLALAAIFTLETDSVIREVGDGGPLLDRSSFPMADFNRIELDRADGRWVFTRDGDEWWQEEPFRAQIEGRFTRAKF